MTQSLIKKRQAPQPPPNRRIGSSSASEPTISIARHYYLAIIILTWVIVLLTRAALQTRWEMQVHVAGFPRPASPSHAATVPPISTSVTDAQCSHCRVRCSPCWSRPRRSVQPSSVWQWPSTPQEKCWHVMQTRAPLKGTRSRSSTQAHSSIVHLQVQMY